MIVKRLGWALVLGLVFISLNAAVAEESVSPSTVPPSEKEILREADKARGNWDGVMWKVYVKSKEKGRQQIRKMIVKAKGYDFLATMTDPPKVKRNKLLMVDHNMWFAKPGIRKPVPVSSRQKLIGGASYGDIAATNYSDDYTPERVTNDTVKGEACYRFDLVAATKKATYDRVRYWISKERLVGVRAEYFTVSGKQFKSAWFRYENEITDGGKSQPFISLMIIEDAIVKDQLTLMAFSSPRLVEVFPAELDVNMLMSR